MDEPLSPAHTKRITGKSTMSVVHLQQSKAIYLICAGYSIPDTVSNTIAVNELEKVTVFKPHVFTRDEHINKGLPWWLSW